MRRDARRAQARRRHGGGVAIDRAAARHRAGAVRPAGRRRSPVARRPPCRARTFGVSRMTTMRVTVAGASPRPAGIPRSVRRAGSGRRARSRPSRPRVARRTACSPRGAREPREHELAPALQLERDGSGMSRTAARQRAARVAHVRAVPTRAPRDLVERDAPHAAWLSPTSATPAVAVAGGHPELAYPLADASARASRHEPMAIAARLDRRRARRTAAAAGSRIELADPCAAAPKHVGLRGQHRSRPPLGVPALRVDVGGGARDRARIRASVAAPAQAKSTRAGHAGDAERVLDQRAWTATRAAGSASGSRSW